MKFELKTVQHNQTLSEETHCFSAKLYIEGVHAFDASNHGQGGPTIFRSTGKFWMSVDEVNAWLAANPPEPWEYCFDYCLEVQVGDLVNDWLVRRELNKLLRKAVVATDGKALFTFKMGDLSSATVPANRIDEMKKALATKNMQFVNLDNNYELALTLV